MEWAAWFVPRSNYLPICFHYLLICFHSLLICFHYLLICFHYLILVQGGDDEGDSDDEELPFEGAGNGGTKPCCIVSLHRDMRMQVHTRRIAALSHAAPKILAIRSSMRLASQNGAKMRGMIR